MSRRPRTRASRAAGDEELVALPSDESSQEEEEYQSSQSEGELGSSSSSSDSGSSAGSDDDDDEEADFEPQTQQAKRDAGRKRAASHRGTDAREQRKKSKGDIANGAGGKATDAKPAQNGSPVRKKRGIAQILKRPRGGGDRDARRNAVLRARRIEEESSLAETTGTEGELDVDVEVEGPGRAERIEERAKGTPAVKNNGQGYTTAKDAPVPVVDDDEEVDQV
ncbi:hypothetical protein KEM52_001346 [Ascosphaera acerosa]|nr:hypothetical protein KEM52_001346 [Ascosphaera acerosa]